jgi:hypothetical protein
LFKNLLEDSQIRVAVLKHDVIAFAHQTRAGRSTHLPVPDFFTRSLPSQLHSVAAGLRPPAGFSGMNSPMLKRFFTLPRV